MSLLDSGASDTYHAEMNISVVYHSESGNTRRVAELVAEGARVSPSVQARVMSLEEMDKGWIESSRAVIFGCPTYAGSLSWQMKQFVDTTSYNLEGKIGAAYLQRHQVFEGEIWRDGDRISRQ